MSLHMYFIDLSYTKNVAERINTERKKYLQRQRYLIFASLAWQQHTIYLHTQYVTIPSKTML